MTERSNTRVRLDRQQLHALAHPLRARLLSALRVDGPATSAQLAKRFETNSGATSYHLRQLAEVGLVADDPDRGTGRERYWRAAHDVTSWSETDFEDDPDDRAATEWLLGHHVRTKQRWRDDWLDERMRWSREWRSAAGLSDMRVRLTPAQLRRMADELHAVIDAYHEAGPEDEATAEDVLVLLDLFPARQVRL